jgi:hypothetical protein
MTTQCPDQGFSESIAEHPLSRLSDKLCLIQQQMHQLERCYFNPSIIIIRGFDENLTCYNSVDDRDHWKLHIYKLFQFAHIPTVYILNMRKEYESDNIVIELMSHNVKIFVYNILDQFCTNPQTMEVIMQH